MYSLIRSLTLRRLLAEQLPTLTFSIVAAEMFYKFHSFTLECLAFLATWGLLDLCVQKTRLLFRRRIPAAGTKSSD